LGLAQHNPFELGLAPNAPKIALGPTAVPRDLVLARTQMKWVLMQDLRALGPDTEPNRIGS